MSALKRGRALACVLLVLGTGVSAHASSGVSEPPKPQLAWRKTGYIEVAAVHPTVPRQIYVSTGSNGGGTFGYVYELPSWADGRPYELRMTGGVLPSGVSVEVQDVTAEVPDDNIDAYFYEDIESTSEDPGGRLCPVVRSEPSPTVETGTVCSGAMRARYAVIVLFTGARADFSFYIPEPN